MSTAKFQEVQHFSGFSANTQGNPHIVLNLALIGPEGTNIIGQTMTDLSCEKTCKAFRMPDADSNWYPLVLQVRRSQRDRTMAMDGAVGNRDS